MVINNLYSDEKLNININIKSNKDLFNKCLNNNNQIDDVLHVITFISNICNFKRRWQLMSEFNERMNKVKNIQFYIVELAYEDQEFKITNSTNPNHLQLRTKYALWHKENLINIGISKLLPSNWKAVAWIDGDIEFEDNNWVNNTLKLLTKFDIVQLFTVCFDLDENNIPMNIWQSYGYKYCNGYTFNYDRGINYWHNGYSWACNRKFYNKIGYIYDKGVIGSGDYILTQGFLDRVACVNGNLTGFNEDIIKFIKKLKKIKVGYIPSIIKHYFHGSKINRKYIERNEILIKNNYNPSKHLTYDKNNILIPTNEMSQEFLLDIKKYFFQRNDDEYYELIKK